MLFPEAESASGRIADKKSEMLKTFWPHNTGWLHYYIPGKV